MRMTFIMIIDHINFLETLIDSVLQINTSQNESLPISEINIMDENNIISSLFHALTGFSVPLSVCE